MNNTPNRNNRPNAPSNAPRNVSGNRTANSAQSRQGAPAQRSTAPNVARPATPNRGTARPTGQPAKAPQRPVTPNRNGGKKKSRFDKDRILAVIMLFLIVILAAIVIIFSVKAIVDTVRNSGGTTTAPSTTVNGGTTAPLKDPVYTTPVAGAWNEGYVTANRKDTLVNEGNLILVNNDYAYTFPASLKLKEMLNKKYGYGSVYVLGTGMTYPTGPKPVELSEVIVDSIKTMLADMKAANPTLTETRKLMILSGYRTLDKQQALYENDPDSGLTAKPGHSEHHTGLTFDIRIKVNDQSEIEYLNDAEQAWITANCAKYGFILRYTEDNKSITQIGGEDWHFRYVGVAHATYMVENDLCLEEYLAFLREKHTYGVNDPLKYAAEGKDYTIYYFPASVEKDNTDIYVPSSGHYEISGDNMNGFIVTVTNS